MVQRLLRNLFPEGIQRSCHTCEVTFDRSTLISVQTVIGLLQYIGLNVLNVTVGHHYSRSSIDTVSQSTGLIELLLSSVVEFIFWFRTNDTS